MCFSPGGIWRLEMEKRESLNSDKIDWPEPPFISWVISYSRIGVPVVTFLLGVAVGWWIYAA